MARKQVKTNEIEIHSWEEADAALREIAVLKSRVDARIAVYNEEEQQRRKAVTEANTPDLEKVERFELGLKAFCENNRADFGKLKTREMAHGSVNFRTSPPKVATRKGFTFASVMELVKRSVWKDEFIRTKEELDKETILIASTRKESAVSADDLAALGLQIVQDETFGYEVKLAVAEVA
jgi:phage host-nuclease inhibitor protein Gam